MSEDSTPLRLKVTTGHAAGKDLSVADELVIGREGSEEGKLGNDVEISRQHARIARTPQGEWAIEDLGSRNGTFVNGHRIDKRELLAAGDAIEVGAARLVVQVSAPTTPPSPAPEPEPEPAKLGATLVGEVVPPPSDAEPAEPETSDAEPAVRPVSLSLELDLVAGQVSISLGEGSDQARFVFEDGVWRLRPEE